MFVQKLPSTPQILSWIALLLMPAVSDVAIADEQTHEPNMVGAVVQYGPAYLGSDRSTPSIIPVLSLTKESLFLRTTEGMLETGISKPINDTLSYGAQLAYEDGRTQNGFSNGLKFLSINPSMSYGAFLQYEDNIGPMPIDVIVRYRKDIDTSRGSQMDFRIFAGIYGGEHEKLNLGIFAQRTLADQRAMETYYGLKDRFSHRFGHVSYHPDQGVLNSEVGLWGAYMLCPKTYLVGYAEKIFLGNEASNSPITRNSNINYISFGLAFEF
jgi:outer membrane scaffolding protein for murein synthesis (MipA/OmpV family)